MEDIPRPRQNLHLDKQQRHIVRDLEAMVSLLHACKASVSKRERPRWSRLVARHQHLLGIERRHRSGRLLAPAAATGGARVLKLEPLAQMIHMATMAARHAEHGLSAHNELAHRALDGKIMTLAAHWAASVLLQANDRLLISMETMSVS